MSRRRMRRNGVGLMGKVGLGIGLVVALFLVIRGVVEPFAIDFNDPASYRADWGGPSLIGVLAVHSGPALVILLAGVVWFARRRA